MSQPTVTRGRSRVRQAQRAANGAGEAAAQAETPAARPTSRLWGLAGFALLVVLVLYSPAMNGPFLFDDLGLPFYVPSAGREALQTWIAGVRPILMLSYWLNYQLSAEATWSYHAVNVLLHLCNSGLLFLIFIRLLRNRVAYPGRLYICAATGAFLFLVHPIQTEAVAYVAGRSELLCGLFVLAALAVYSRAEGPVSWRRSLSVLALYAAAVLSKEHAAVLPAAFLVIDVLIRGHSFKQVLRDGARLYLPVTVVAAVAAAGVLISIGGSPTAGFSVPGVPWYAYFFTQFRVWLLYIGLAVFPVGQNLDYDLALSHSLRDHGAAAALIVLLGAAVLVWSLRRRFPVAAAGVLLFAIFLAPTSSVVPLQDLAAERRMYLPLAGLLLVALQWLASLSDLKGARYVVLAYLAVCSLLTYQRASLWSSDLAFWSNVTQQSPGKVRGYAHLAYAYMRQRRCGDAIDLVQRAPEAVRGAPEVLSVIGHAYSCNGRLPDAVQAFERAVAAGPGPGRMLTLADAYRRAGRLRDADVAEQKALSLPPKTRYDFSMLETFNRQTRSRTAESQVN